jgi:hypothetical protein
VGAHASDRWAALGRHDDAVDFAALLADVRAYMSNVIHAVLGVSESWLSRSPGAAAVLVALIRWLLLTACAAVLPWTAYAAELRQVRPRCCQGSLREGRMTCVCGAWAELYQPPGSPADCRQ